MMTRILAGLWLLAAPSALAAASVGSDVVWVGVMHLSGKDVVVRYNELERSFQSTLEIVSAPTIYTEVRRGGGDSTLMRQELNGRYDSNHIALLYRSEFEREAFRKKLAEDPDSLSDIENRDEIQCTGDKDEALIFIFEKMTTGTRLRANCVILTRSQRG